MQDNATRLAEQPVIAAGLQLHLGLLNKMHGRKEF